MKRPNNIPGPDEREALIAQLAVMDYLKSHQADDSSQEQEELFPEPDPDFLRRMRRSIARQHRIDFRKRHWKPLTAISAVLVFALSGTVYAQRDIIANFFFERGGKSVHISTSSPPDPSNTSYSDFTGVAFPSYVPEGFSMVKSSGDQSEDPFSIEWQDKQGNYFILTQYTGHQYNLEMIGGEWDDVEGIEIKGIPGVCSVKQGTVSVVWGSGPQWNLFGNISKEEALHIARSVCASK